MSIEREGEAALSGWCVLWRRGRSGTVLLNSEIETQKKATATANGINRIYADAEILLIERSGVLVKRMMGAKS